MNEPIVSPWIFYLLGLLGSLEGAFNIITGITIVLLFIIALFVIIAKDVREFAFNNDVCKKILKRYAIAFAVMFVVCVFLPSKETAYKMIIASYITPQNIEVVQDTANKSIDYLINKIIEAADKWEQRGAKND